MQPEPLSINLTSNSNVRMQFAHTDDGCKVMIFLGCFTALKAWNFISGHILLIYGHIDHCKVIARAHSGLNLCQITNKLIDGRKVEIKY